MSRELLKRIRQEMILPADIEEQIDEELAKTETFQPDWANYRQGKEDGKAEATTSSKWHANRESDPHGKRYDCERAMLCKGNLTDDELANALYLCDHRTSFESIGLITAAKDRIRWLSRALERALSEP